MYSIEYRRPEDGRTLFETDDREPAIWLLQAIAETPGVQLIDYSGNLDGVLDGALNGITLFGAPAPVAPLAA
jgi:hypothetical protein